MRLCTSEKGFDFSAWLALRSEISIAEAKEIEAVLCVEGDNRHTFQTWYPDWAERQSKKTKSQPVQDMFAELAGKSVIDVELVKRELAAVKVAIAETQESLAKHRQDIATGGDGFDPRVVEVLEAQAVGLKHSRGLLEEQLLEAGPKGGVSDGD